MDQDGGAHQMLNMLAVAIMATALAFSDDEISPDAPAVPSVDPAQTVPAAGTGKPAGPATAPAPDPDWTPKQRVEHVLKSYAACFGIDWRVLKAIGHDESGLDPWNVTGSKADPYRGLFQLDSAACSDNLKGFDFLDCDDLHDPEANAAAAAYRFDRLLDRIEKHCGADTLKSVRDAAMLVYVGHNNGPAVLNSVLAAKACKAEDPKAAEPSGQEKAVREWYLNRAEGPLLLSYREETDSPAAPEGASGNCRSGFKKYDPEKKKKVAIPRPDGCYVRIATACRGRRQLELYERGANPNQAMLRPECVPPAGGGEQARVSRYRTVDEGWAAEKWWVGDSIASKISKWGARSGRVDKDPALCPTARLVPEADLKTMFPKGADY